MVRMRLAVAIPVWNRRAFVLEAIQSILNQSHPDVDIHIFDNASTDGTPAAVQAEFGGQVALHLNAENVGYVGNVNRCLSLESNYDWIAILHSDDMHLDHSLTRIFTAIETNASAGIIFGQQVSFGDSDQYSNSNVCEIRLHKSGDRAVRRTQFQLPCSSTAYSALAIRKKGGFSTDYPYSADEEYNARIASQFDIVEIASPLSMYRRHSQQTMLATWRHEDFIASFERMRIRMNSYLTEEERVQERQVYRQIATTLLGHASALVAAGEMHIVRRFYYYALKKHPICLLYPNRFARAIIHFMPIIGPLVCRNLSRNYTHNATRA